MSNATSETFAPLSETTATVRGHLEICRFDHWIKNVFVLPGIIAAFALTQHSPSSASFWNIIVALLATGFIASSNYVINEVLDAPFDRTHPIKQNRPVPRGLVYIPIAYAQWLALCVAGLFFGHFLSSPVVWTLLALWIMGCIYNIRPVRSKDIPYLDVLTEAVNNPIRLMIGWYAIANDTIPPVSLVLSYWMIGCYFMALKRYSELLRLSVGNTAREYRKSLAHFTPQGLLISVMFYASSAMLLFGAFLMRYRMSLILSFPAIAWVMAVYLSMAFKKDGAAENPEKLYREKGLMIAVAACVIAMSVLLFIRVPWVDRTFKPTVMTEPVFRGR